MLWQKARRLVRTAKTSPNLASWDSTPAKGAARPSQHDALQLQAAPDLSMNPCSNGPGRMGMTPSARRGVESTARAGSLSMDRMRSAIEMDGSDTSTNGTRHPYTGPRKPERTQEDTRAAGAYVRIRPLSPSPLRPPCGPLLTCDALSDRAAHAHGHGDARRRQRALLGPGHVARQRVDQREGAPDGHTRQRAQDHKLTEGGHPAQPPRSGSEWRCAVTHGTTGGGEGLTNRSAGRGWCR
jgi:hypothetical protein